jgi:hypothetical protein
MSEKNLLIILIPPSPFDPLSQLYQHIYLYFFMFRAVGDECCLGGVL